jgi:hypothetical protein
MVADTWDTHSREDVAERTMLSARSRTGGTRVQDVGYTHARGAILTAVWWLSLKKPPCATDDGFLLSLGLKNLRRWFLRELVVACGVTADDAST